MLSHVSPDQFEWFTSWIENFHAIPQGEFDHYAVIAHPGTTFIDDGRSPFASPNIDPTSDEDPSPEQESTLDRILLERCAASTPCVFALYAGYLDHRDRGASDGFNEPLAAWYLGRLNYVLFSAPLGESTFGAVKARWGIDAKLQSLSYLWPEDRSWMLISTADSAVTLVGGDIELVERIVSVPGLDAHYWQESRLQSHPKG